MMSMNEIKTRHDFKIGDVIEVSMSIEPQNLTEYDEKSIIDLSHYAAQYKIHYSYPRELGFSILDFTVDKGCSGDFGDDIKLYLEKYLKNDIEEIMDYELFDVDNKGEYQIAKIRVKALKKD